MFCRVEMIRMQEATYLYINNLEYESEDICDEQIFSTNQSI